MAAAAATEVIDQLKFYIDHDALEAAQNYLFEIQETYDLSDLPMDFVFQKVYIHACLKKRRAFLPWLQTLYDALDPIQQIAVRQVFSYGKFLLNK